MSNFQADSDENTLQRCTGHVQNSTETQRRSSGKSTLILFFTVSFFYRLYLPISLTNPNLFLSLLFSKPHPSSTLNWTIQIEENLIKSSLSHERFRSENVHKRLPTIQFVISNNDRADILLLITHTTKTLQSHSSEMCGSVFINIVRVSQAIVA